MEKKFDVALKALLEDDPCDLPALVGVSDPRVEVIDADIATISGAADKVLRLHGPPPSILHFEFQASPDGSLPRRVNVYNAAMEDRHDLPVCSVVVLLRPEANLAAINGRYWRRVPGASRPYRIFRYQVIRVWELLVADLLHGGLARLALAPIGAVREAELPEVLAQMKQRAARLGDRGRLGRWWTAVYVLMGLRYQQAVVDQLLQGVLDMEESATYQAILRKGMARGMAEGVAQGVVEGRALGAVEEARKMLLQMGEHRFQAPAPADLRSRLEGMQDLPQLEELLLRVGQVQSWEELLRALPRQRRRRPPRR
jgi:predicted transposase YdaD